MSRDKQIEEMVKTLSTCECDCLNCKSCYSWELCEALYNAGYRKASDIFEEIEKAITAKIIINGKIIYDPLISLAELKNKYEREKTK